MPSKQWFIWMAVAVPAFVIGGLTAAALALPPKWAFAAGFILSIPLDLLAGWLQDWKEVEQEVAEFAP